MVADAVRVPVPLSCGQVMVSAPGCTLLPSGGASCKACDAFRAAVGCCVSWVGTFQVNTKELPTSGSAPSVTTNAPVFLLKVPAP